MLSYQMCYCLKVAFSPICPGQSSFITAIFPLMFPALSPARPINYFARSPFQKDWVEIGTFLYKRIHCFEVCLCPGFKYKPNLSAYLAEGTDQQVWEAFPPTSEAVTLWQAALRDLSSQCLHG